MKTAEEKIDAYWIEYFGHDSSRAWPRLKDMCVLALKEQDKQTRHACAEAVMALNGRVHHLDSMGRCIDKHAASAACMNVRAV